MEKDDIILQELITSEFPINEIRILYLNPIGFIHYTLRGNLKTIRIVKQR